MIWRKSIYQSLSEAAVERLPFGQGTDERRSGMAAESNTDLEAELSALLEVERFEPPEEFRKRALWSDPAVYEEAAADPEAWWLRQATDLLDWVEPPSQGLDESNPPFFKWFADGTLNASAN
jgi:acetyl-CoA synthetase